MSEEGDYEEFMMSEEDISSFEMEVDSEEGEQEDIPVDRDTCSEFENNKLCEGWYSTGKAFRYDQQYESAKKWFRKCSCTPKWRFKSLKQVIKCEISEGLPIEESLDELFKCVEAHMDILGRKYVAGSLRKLIDRVAPDLNSHFLFLGEEQPFDVPSLEHVSLVLDLFDREGLKADKDVRDLIHIRKLVYSAWIHFLRGDQIPDSILESMMRYSHLETYFLMLQLHLNHYLQTNEIELTVLQIILDEVEHFMKHSLSVSQKPTVTSIYHFARFLEYWKRTTYQEDDEILSNCEEQLVLCIQDFETIGLQRQVESRLFQLSTVGVIFCNLLLSSEDRVVPFDREQLKVLEANPLVQLLKEFHLCWTKMDLHSLTVSITKLRPFFSPWFDEFEGKLIRMCQSNKLWNQIAPTYSHIAVNDLLAKLHIGATISMTRDDLLTLLMKSIAKDTAKVYYKLNLQLDYVYFGDEFRVPLRSIEQSFIDAAPQPAETGMVSREEWLCNVDNWNNPLVLPKKTTALQFMDCLSANRLRDSQQAVKDTSIESFLLKLSVLTHEIGRSASSA